ncbi:hypothetical protein [Streptomyces pseudogriseolus]|uniref:hypothetical protein n=1 Tax=Streptomyces pseudogriseolus TaxID=36817 RepID=UPI001180F6E3
MRSLGDSGLTGRAKHLDACLSGEEAPDTPQTSRMVMAAAALTPKRPISQSARARALAAMMREADRVTRRPAAPAAVEDTTDPGIHIRTANAGPNLRLRVADIEAVDDDRLEQIAANIAMRLGQRAPDRNQ